MSTPYSGDQEVTVGREEDHVLFNQFAAHYDAPAYVRRARRVEQEFEQLLARGRARRDEYLRMVRVRLALLRALAGTWDTLRPWLVDDAQLVTLERLHVHLEPRLGHRVDATS